MVQAIVPEFAVEASVPIETGLAKDPAELESCAVKIFPVFAGPSPLNETLTVLPAQMELEESGVVVIVDNTLDPAAMVKFTLEMSKKIFPTAATFTLAVVEVIAGTVIVALPLFGTLAAKVNG